MTCQKPRTTITIPKGVLFCLMSSHSKLAQAEYERNKAYNDSHFSAVAEHNLIKVLDSRVMKEFFDYVAKEVLGHE